MHVQHQCDAFRQEAETAQKQVQDYVQEKHKREAELYVKVTIHVMMAVSTQRDAEKRMAAVAAVCSRPQ